MSEENVRYLNAVWKYGRVPWRQTVDYRDDGEVMALTDVKRRVLRTETDGQVEEWRGWRRRCVEGKREENVLDNDDVERRRIELILKTDHQFNTSV